MEMQYRLEESGVYSKIEQRGDFNFLPLEFSLNGDLKKYPLLIIKTPMNQVNFSCNTSCLQCNSYSVYDGTEFYLTVNPDESNFNEKDEYLFTLNINEDKLLLYMRVMIKHDKDSHLLPSSVKEEKTDYENNIYSFGWNPCNTRSSGDERVSPKGTFAPVWRFSGEINSCVGSGDNLYFTSGNSIYCINVSERIEKWFYPDEEKISFYPLIKGDWLFFAHKSGKLTCYSSPEGRKLWDYTFPGGGLKSPLCLDGDLIFFLSKDLNIYALDIKERNIKWSLPAEHENTSPLNGKGGKLFSGSPAGIKCINALNGEVFWKKNIDNHVTKFTPCITDSLLFTIKKTAGLLSESLVALDIFSGEIVWEKRLEKSIAYHIVSSGSLLFTVIDEEIICYEVSTGNLRWKYHTGNVKISISYHRGYLYYFDNSGVFKIIDGNTGHMIKTRNMDMKLAAPLFVTGGRVYFAGRGDQIYCYTEVSSLTGSVYRTTPITFLDTKTEELIVCPACNTATSAVASLCRYCNTPLNKVSYPTSIMPEVIPDKQLSVTAGEFVDVPPYKSPGNRSGPETGSLNTKYCAACGELINAKAEICVKCGVRQISSRTYGSKSKVVAALLAFFLGGIGGHKFYLGQIGWGLIYLVFCWTGIPVIVAFIELIIYLVMSDEEFARKYG